MILSNTLPRTFEVSELVPAVALAFMIEVGHVAVLETEGVCAITRVLAASTVKSEVYIFDPGA
jgi:hypothetical protein